MARWCAAAAHLCSVAHRSSASAQTDGRARAAAARSASRRSSWMLGAHCCTVPPTQQAAGWPQRRTAARCASLKSVLKAGRAPPRGRCVLWASAALRRTAELLAVRACRGQAHPQATVMGVAWAASGVLGPLLASFADDGLVKLWRPQAASWALHCSLGADRAPPLTRVAFAPGAALLAAADAAGVVRVYEAADPAASGSWELQARARRRVFTRVRLGLTPCVFCRAVFKRARLAPRAPRWRGRPPVQHGRRRWQCARQARRPAASGCTTRACGAGPLVARCRTAVAPGTSPQSRGRLRLVRANVAAYAAAARRLSLLCMRCRPRNRAAGHRARPRRDAAGGAAAVQRGRAMHQRRCRCAAV